MGLCAQKLLHQRVLDLMDCGQGVRQRFRHYFNRQVGQVAYPVAFRFCGRDGTPHLHIDAFANNVHLGLFFFPLLA